VAAASGTYGGTISLTATLTLTANGAGLSGKTISFTLNHASVGSASTNNSGVATLSNISLAGISPRTYIGDVSANFAGDTSDLAGTGTGDLTVTRAPLTITANNRSKTYGDSVAFAGTEFTTTGLVSGDTVTSVTLTSAGVAANASVAGSPYPIVPSAAVGSALGNYTISYLNGTLIVNTKPAAVTPDAKSKVYGSADPTLTGTLTGFLPPDNVLASYSRVAGETVSGGPYTITATLSPAAVLSNYTITYNTGKLTINPAPLTITANNAARSYGMANPAFTVSYSGFVLGESPGVLGGTLSFSTSAAPASAPGMYTITPGGLTASNYSITFRSGTLTVTAAPLSANGQNITPIAGAPFSGVVATFTNADPFGGANSYTAMITWGDGDVSAGTITDQGGGTLAVTGSNTYADPKSYSLQVLIQHKLGYTTSATTNGTATVSSLGLGVQSGQTASIYFWAGSRGQALISSFNGGPSATGLANWLALTFPNLYGAQAGAHNLFGKSNAQVATFFQTLYPLSLLDAEVLATAFNVYATTLSLGGTAAQAYGFTVTATGVGANSVNVRGNGTAFGVANFTTLNVYELLLAVNRRAVNGVLYNGDMSLRIEAWIVLDALNIGGGVG
jgi:hypothetical protein